MNYVITPTIFRTRSAVEEAIACGYMQLNDPITDLKQTLSIVVWQEEGNLVTSNRLATELWFHDVYKSVPQDSVEWSDIRANFITPKWTCSLCKSEQTSDTAATAKHTSGSYCSAQCADAADLKHLLNLIKESGATD